MSAQVASGVTEESPSGRLLTLGRVDRVRVQVGYRARPDGAAYELFLLDVPVPDGAQALDEGQVLEALEPVVYAGTDRPRHYSLHQHRWHTSWGASPGALEIGLLVTTGRTPADGRVADEPVAAAFRDLLALAGTPATSEPTSRDAAILAAQRSASAAFAVDPELLSVSEEEHHHADNTWLVGLRASSGDEYDVLVGLVDGYAGSVRVRHHLRTEVSDSVGSD